MNRLIQFFIERTFLVNLISAFVMILGAVSFMNMKTDLVPQWKINQIQISTFLEGASPDQVENHVTFPLEEAVQNFSGIDQINSYSTEGSARITIRMKEGLSATEQTDLFEEVKAAVEGVRSELPQDIEQLNVVNQKVTNFWFTSMSVLNFEKENPQHRKWLKDFSDALRKVPGIVKVNDRASTPEIRIQFDQKALARYRLNPVDIQRLIGDQFRPLPVGSFERGESTIGVQLERKVEGLDDLNNMIIQGNASGNNVLLKDVAKVSYGLPKEEYRQYTNGIKSISLNIFKDLEADTLATKEDVNAVVEKYNKLTPKGVSVEITENSSSFIERQLNVLKNNAIMGVILVVLVLFAFLGLKTSLMTTFGLPLAYFATFIVLGGMGMKVDLISVVGMILILGILVDDAIIVSEQYMQFLEEGHSPKEAAYLAVKKTMVPIIGTVLTTIVAFSPILFGGDGLSDFLAAIPWVVIAALGMSLIESFFVLPNHLAHFVKKPIIHKESGLMAMVKRVYGRLLKFSLKWRYPLIVIFVAFSGWTFYFASEKVPFNFNLNISSEKVSIVAILKESPSLDHTEEKMQPLWELLKKLDKKDYSYIEGNLGWAWVSGKEYNGKRYGFYSVRFSQTHPDIEAAKKRVRDFLNEELPKLKTDDFEKLEALVEKNGFEEDKAHTVRVKIVGKQQVDLENLLDLVKERSLELPETKSVYLDPKLVIETWRFNLNDSALKSYNITPIALSEQLRQFVIKRKIKEVRYNGESIKVYSFFRDSDELDYKELNNLPILGNFGRIHRLKDLGSWSKTKRLREISHRDLQRTYIVDVKFDPEKIKKEVFVKKLDELVKPLGTQFESLRFIVEDADDNAAKNKKSMNKMAIFCVLLIFLVLAVVLNSLFQPLLICAAIPFGVVGVIWAFYFHGQSIDVMAIVGIIGMAGVVVNDSLIMVDTINHIVASKKKFSHDEIIAGALTRIRAILLTSITTLGGVFPMAYGIGGDSGFTKPLALSMGWGLFLATFLTLFLIPAMLGIQTDILKLMSSLGTKFSKKTKPAEAKAQTSGDPAHNSKDETPEVPLQ